LESGSNVGVIGSGETAASIVMTLVQQLAHREVRIFIINRQGCLFSRGESYDENRRYSDPSEWSEIPLDARRDIIQRTDRGVFSLSSKRIIDPADNVEHLMASVREIKIVGGLPHVVGSIGKKAVDYEFNYLINATGFNPLWFVDLMERNWKAKLPNKEQVALKIVGDLSVSGVQPRLHLPMLAGLTQGPGFPNLSCLGHLSDRVLSSYVSSVKESEAPR